MWYQVYYVGASLIFAVQFNKRLKSALNWLFCPCNDLLCWVITAKERAMMKSCGPRVHSPNLSARKRAIPVLLQIVLPSTSRIGRWPRGVPEGRINFLMAARAQYIHPFFDNLHGFNSGHFSNVTRSSSYFTPACANTKRASSARARTGK